MGMNIGSGNTGDHDEVIATINTTPLVDVMLVLLIIFLITIPVVNHTVPVQLPQQKVRPLESRPDNILLAVDRAGKVYWNEQPITDEESLRARLFAMASKVPQPDVQIRGDMRTRYEAIAKVVDACKSAGIEKLVFVTQPVAKGS
ncbi:ExbD/TolR family protein [Paraburkholderia sediminicola]|uniref:ExbD/TolR family protein n=1 Tax=Paraburkholderia sediminicola TaxID=458836 RepID=UPI0038B90C4A